MNVIDMLAFVVNGIAVGLICYWAYRFLNTMQLYKTTIDLSEDPVIIARLGSKRVNIVMDTIREQLNGFYTIWLPMIACCAIMLISSFFTEDTPWLLALISSAMSTAISWRVFVMPMIPISVGVYGIDVAIAEVELQLESLDAHERTILERYAEGSFEHEFLASSLNHARGECTTSLEGLNNARKQLLEFKRTRSN